MIRTAATSTSITSAAADAVRPRVPIRTSARISAAIPTFAAVVRECEARLRAIVDPEAADRLARDDQRAHIEKFGGIEAILKRGTFRYSPPPGAKASYSVQPAPTQPHHLQHLEHRAVGAALGRRSASSSRSSSPDVLCLQELRRKTRTLLDKALAGHDRVEDGFVGWTSESNIYWRHSMLSEIEHGAEDVRIKEKNRRLFWARLG